MPKRRDTMKACSTLLIKGRNMTSLQIDELKTMLHYIGYNITHEIKKSNGSGNTCNIQESY